MLDIDEAQGLTLEKIEAYLRNRKGWLRIVTATGPRWQIPAGMDSYSTSDIRFLVARIAEVEQVTEQHLLRAINPRLRDGWPSDEALGVCGHWIVQWGKSLMIFDSFVMREWRAVIKSHIRCWPCDEHGNKVRWPEKAGDML